MNGRRMSGWLAAALGLALALPSAADAQVRIRVNWEFGNDRFYTAGTWGNAYATARIPGIGVVAYQPLRYEPVWGVRIPRGFRPAYGMCRLWYPGVAPGQQPAPFHCGALRGQFHPDVLIVTWRGVMRPVWHQQIAAYYQHAPQTRIWGARYDGRLGRVVAYDGRFRQSARWNDRRYRNWWDDRYDDWWDDGDRWYDDRWEGRRDRGDRWDDRRDRGDRWDDRRDRGDRWDDRWDRDRDWNRNDRGNNGRGPGDRPGFRPGQDRDRGNGARGDNGRGNGNRPAYRPGQGKGRSGAASSRAPVSRPAVAARTVRVRGDR